MSDERPVGIFDSGIGGLTVLKEIRKRLPGESLIYLGDTARVPYGSKSRRTVYEYSKNNIRFLKEHDVKMVVVACNTASAYALPELADGPDPVIGVVEGGVEEAVRRTKGAVAVIGTEATIKSEAYTRAILSLSPGLAVSSKACPLFVPLVEEGWTGREVTRHVAHEYLDEFSGKIDTLVLGCTHYPLLKDVIGDTLGAEVALIDSAEQTARRVEEELDRRGLRSGADAGTTRFVVTDSPERSLEVGIRMIGDFGAEKPELVDISDFSNS